MSTMLEQAIVDAKSLKDAALKNAENALLEKYSKDIKSAVETLLEAEGDELGGGEEDPMMDVTGGEELEDTFPEITSAVADGEELCPCPENDEEINIDFDQLVAAVDAEEESLAGSDGLEGLVGDIDTDEDDDDLGIELQEGVDEDEDDEDDDKPLQEEGIELEGEEEEEISEAALEEVIQEILHVDHIAQPSGTIGGYGYTNIPEIDSEAGWNTARMNSDTLAQEEVKLHQKTTKNLQESIKKYKLQTKEYAQKTKRYAKVVNTLKEKLDEMTLTNAKLLYTNKVLNSGSLNERQSKKIVEAISKAGSINEAKVIYETLKSAVGSVQRKRTQPKSLSEAVARKPAFLSRREPKSAPSGELTRWHVLAGLDKK